MICWTLQKYIFREMGKTFLLTAVGLVAVLGLGGGVMNMLEVQDITALQLLKIMALVLPLAASLTLPIAALYSATVTYGRLSADNEFVACRSGGINIHILLLPTLVISLVSAAFSFVFINFLIPGMIMNMDRFLGADLPRIIKQQLSTPNRLGLGSDRYHIYADRTELAPTETPDGEPDMEALRLLGVAFVEMDGDKWTRFGTAESVEMRFELEGNTKVIAADMYDISLFDAKAGRYVKKHYLPIDRYTFDQGIPLKVKWLNLGDLLRYNRQPTLFPPVQEDLRRFQNDIATALFYRDLADQFQKTAPQLREYGQIEFGDETTHYVIQTPRVERDKKDRRPRFEGGITIIEKRSDGVERTIHADEAALISERTRGAGVPRMMIRVTGSVSVEDSRNPGDILQRPQEDLPAVPIPERFIQRAYAYTDAELISADARSLGLGTEIDEAQKKLAVEVGKVERDITGVLHSRLAFSLSVFVLVILGAALGIVFRGAHVLTAFGISFVPSLFVIAMIIMGKQLIDNPSTTAAGVGVIWLGIILVAAGDLFTLIKVVRR